MASIFISYKRENFGPVQFLVQALRANAVEVWWDQDIAADAAWEATIERELNTARIVIVAWSQAAVVSENVKAEARRARNAGKLIQVFVEKCDPPLFFGERQGVDLSNWNGDASDHRFQAVLTAVRAILAGKRPPEGAGYAPKKARPFATILAAMGALSLVLGLIANAGGARDTICSISAIQRQCMRLGLTQPAVDPNAARLALLHRAEGIWGNVGSNGAPACSTSMRYVLSRRDGEDYIDLTMPNYQSEGRVVSAEKDSIFTRTVSPASQAGTQWELRLESDRLIQVDSSGTPTPLIRCGG